MQDSPWRGPDSGARWQRCAVVGEEGEEAAAVAAKAAAVAAKAAVEAGPAMVRSTHGQLTTPATAAAAVVPAWGWAEASVADVADGCTARAARSAGPGKPLATVVPAAVTRRRRAT